MREGGAARDARREKEETGASSRFHLVGSITFGEKTDAATLGDRLRNRYVLALKHVFETGRAIRAPAGVRRLGRKVVAKLQ